MLQDLYYLRLTPDERRDFDWVRSALAAGRLSVELPGCTNDPQHDLRQLQPVVHALHWSCPELFWINFWNYKLSCVPFLSRRVLLFESLIPPEQIRARRRQFDSRVDAICAQAMQYSRVLDRETFLHDLLSSRVSYRLEPGHRVSTAESVLLRCYGICGGYARAFALLCTRCGISCAAVYGSTRHAGHTSHAWNLVDLGRGARCVDVTWDSCATAGRFRCARKYLNFPLTSRDHFLAADLQS